MSKSTQLKRAERFRFLANECRLLAANDPYTESRNYYLQVVELAEAAELKTTRAHEPLRRVRPNSRTPRTIRPKDPMAVAPPDPLKRAASFNPLRAAELSRPPPLRGPHQCPCKCVNLGDTPCAITAYKT
jgi:hypothetical protein